MENGAMIVLYVLFMYDPPTFPFGRGIVLSKE